MSSNVCILFNPACAKCRQTLTLLNDHGEQPDVVHYLDTPPSRQQLREILHMLGLPARALLRTHEAAYAQAGLEDSTLDDEALIAAMIAHPILIERPIVIKHGKAIIARPPERVLDILCGH